MTTAKRAGRISSVANVDTTRPPMTARPSGACIWLPASRASAIGTMPMIMAQAVIRMGRKRSRPPRTAASGTDSPRASPRAVNETSITELDTDTPMLMIAPMNDSMLSVVPVT